jgi:hypothetical protein
MSGENQIKFQNHLQNLLGEVLPDGFETIPVLTRLFSTFYSQNRFQNRVGQN